jgi:hypothetical protein
MASRPGTRTTSPPAVTISNSRARSVHAAPDHLHRMVAGPPTLTPTETDGPMAPPAAPRSRVAPRSLSLEACRERRKP